jgi:hypothetical protein
MELHLIIMVLTELLTQGVALVAVVLLFQTLLQVVTVAQE